MGPRTGLIGRSGVGMLLVTAVACSSSPPIDPQVFVDELQRHRQEREARLAAEDGWLTLIALHWLSDGDTRFGTRESLELVLPPGSGPELAGTLRLVDGELTLQAAPGVDLSVGGEPLGGEPARLDRVDGASPVVACGRIRFLAIERDGRIAIRVKDPESATRREFQGLDYFPASLDWRVTGRFRAYEEPRQLEIPTAAGTIADLTAPGTVELRFDGRDVSLQIFAEADGSDPWVAFRDATSGDSTYPSGRYLQLERDGDVWIADFNRSYNPPCAFTAYATCPLPPRQNWLESAVEAGEKAPGALH